VSKLRVHRPVFRVGRIGNIDSSSMERALRLPVRTLQTLRALVRIRPDVVLTNRLASPRLC
jgi:hypothetical protein